MGPPSVTVTGFEPTYVSLHAHLHDFLLSVSSFHLPPPLLSLVSAVFFVFVFVFLGCGLYKKVFPRRVASQAWSLTLVAERPFV